MASLANEFAPSMKSFLSRPALPILARAIRIQAAGYAVRETWRLTTFYPLAARANPILLARCAQAYPSTRPFYKVGHRDDDPGDLRAC